MRVFPLKTIVSRKSAAHIYGRAKFGGLEWSLAFRVLRGALLVAMSSHFCWAQAASDDPWAKLEDSPSMTCLDNEAELNRMWVDDGDLYWSDYGNVSAICRRMTPEAEGENVCVVSRRDSNSQQWYFKIDIEDSTSSMKVENFFDFDIGQWDLITEMYGMQERATFPCW